MSGEALKGDNDRIFARSVLDSLARELIELQKTGCQIGIVIGGGNIWRHRDFCDLKMKRTVSDTIGMLATIMNAMAFEDILKNHGAEVRAMSSLSCESAMENYNPQRALRHLKKNRIVIFAGGTGSPFFTTDSAAALHALETECDILLKATMVDYVYDKDPHKYPDAQKYEKLTYREVLSNSLEVMDMTCAALCQAGNLPILVFNLKKGNILKAVSGQKIGTIII